MTNHVHWVVVPERTDSLAVLFRRVNGRYAQYLNARRRRTGHLWQNRFFSCPVAAEKEESVLQYVEWNPLRAGMVEQPQEYKWSCGALGWAGSGANPFIRLGLLASGGWSRRMEEAIGNGGGRAGSLG